MSTAAENARRAQEDAMMRAIAQQAAAAQQRQQEMATMRGDRAASQDAAVRAAQVQADAQIRAAEILAQRESANNAAIGDRQLALAREGQKMTEAQKAALALQERQFRSTPAGMLENLLSDDMSAPATAIPEKAPMPDEFVGSPYATKSHTGAAPYDMTRFNADVADIAENVKVARNQSDGQLSYDDLPAYSPDKQGAFIRDPTGVMRQVHFATPTLPKQQAVEAVKASMVPEPPIPGVAGGGAAAVAAPALPAAPAVDPKQARMDSILKVMRALGMIPEDPEAARSRDKQSKADTFVSEQAEAILDQLAGKPRLTPRESAQWRDVASQYAKATGTGVLRQAPVESTPVEFVKSELEDFSNQAEKLAGGSFGYASEDDMVALRLKAQEIKTAMQRAGYDANAIQQVVRMMDYAMKRTEDGVILKTGITEPKRIRILSEY